MTAYARDLRYEKYMREAVTEAREAFASGEFPVGAVIVSDDEIIARAHNLRQTTGDPTAHAEVLALRQAAAVQQDWRLESCELYVTLEPCPMCAGAILNARIGKVIFGAYDPQRGCCASVYRLMEDPAFNAFVPCVGGVLEAECSGVIAQFLNVHRK